MRDEPVFIVGGGPSLASFQFSRLYGAKTIAINSSIFDVPTADWFVTMDYTSLRKMGIHEAGIPSRRDYFNSLKARKHFIISFNAPRLEVLDRFHYLDTAFGLRYDLTQFDEVVVTSGYGGLGRSLEDFKTGSESGYSAIQLAAALGFKTIYLLGLDFSTKFGSSHYHERYGTLDPREYEKTLKEFLSPYPNMVQCAREMGIEIISLSPISKLNGLIPQKNWSEVLN